MLGLYIIIFSNTSLNHYYGKWYPCSKYCSLFSLHSTTLQSWVPQITPDKMAELRCIHKHLYRPGTGGSFNSNGVIQTHHIPTPLNATNGIEMWQTLKGTLLPRSTKVYPENGSQDYSLSLSRDSLHSPDVEFVRRYAQILGQ